MGVLNDFLVLNSNHDNLLYSRVCTAISAQGYEVTYIPKLRIKNNDSWV